VTGAVLVAALVLAWAGIAKAWRPGTTARALAATPLPHAPGLVRAFAVLEVVVAVGALTVGGPFAVAMGCSYAGFAGFVAVALRRGWPLSSCGCFGVADARPTRAHVVADAALAAAAFAAAVDGLRPIAVLADRPAEGAALAVVAAVTAGLLVIVLSVLPELAAA
jgi:hypothetical protein